MQKRKFAGESEPERSLFDLQPGVGDAEPEIERVVTEHWQEDPEPAFDIIKARADGVIILGNKKTSDRGTMMIVPGLNDSSFIEMGDLGFLTGAAQKMYEKIKTWKVNGNYEPGNCRWATALEQAQNRRGTNE